MYLAPLTLPTTMPRAHEGLFTDVKAPRNPSFNEEDVSDNPPKPETSLP